MSPIEAMQMAIAEGKKGAGFVSPNPLVGCVIVDKNRNFLSSGYHAKVGFAHAEADALLKIKDLTSLEGAHVYVTLEPCAHQGRTPSCAKALAGLPIESVTYGLEDPYIEVRGQGAEILRRAGKKVILFSELKTELEELAEIFLMNQRHHRPFVALKVAASLDGKIALENGLSQWITGEEARAHVQYLRGCYDAVLVGAGTVMKDSPRLNSRDPAFATRESRVVILDPQGSTVKKLPQSPLWQSRPAQNIFLVTAPGISAPEGVQHIECPVTSQGLDLPQVLDSLFQRGLKSVFVEGGGSTYSGFLQARLADRLYLFTAPMLLGRGLSWTNDLKLSELSEARRLTGGRQQIFGDDVFFTAKLT